MTAQQDLEQLLDIKGKKGFFHQAWESVNLAARPISDPEFVLSRFFSEDGIKEMMPIVKKRISEIEAEVENEIKIEQKIQDAIYKFERGNYFAQECENPVRAYAVVGREQIKVVARETGMGNVLPSHGRKYVGDRQRWVWEYPLAAHNLIRSCQHISLIFDEKGDAIS